MVYLLKESIQCSVCFVEMSALPTYIRVYWYIARIEAIDCGEHDLRQKWLPSQKCCRLQIDIHLSQASTQCCADQLIQQK